MAGLIYHSDKRRVIPQIERAEKFKKSILPLEELGNQHFIKPTIEFKDEELESKIEKWKTTKSKKLGGDILSSAIVNDEMEKIRDIVSYLKTNYPNDIILNKIFDKNNNTNKIAHNRKKLILEPKDAITWTDQAINYIDLGNREKALKCIQSALSINNNQAFILRNASRIYNLCGDNGEAIKILKRSEYYKYDPQILASEIAFSQLENRRSKGPDFGYKILKEGNFNPHEITELSSALGTSEYFQGNLIKSEKLFNQALISPNNNSLAQSLWYKQDEISDEIFNLNNNSNEIQTHKRANASDFNNSLKFALKWIKDEPYSKRPYNTAAHLSGVLLGQYEKAIELEKENLNKQQQIKGKLSTEEDFSFRNDLAYYLLKNEQINEATKLLLPMMNLILTKTNLNHKEYFNIATFGLLFYRMGKIDMGKKLYRKAIKYFIDHDKLYNARSAFYNFFLEEIKVQDDIEILNKLRKELDFMIPVSAQNDMIFLKDKAIKEFNYKMQKRN